MKNIYDVNENNFQDIIENSNNDFLIEFWASWCPPCKMMDKLLLHLMEDSELNFKVAKINVDRNRKLADRFNIYGVPSFLKYKNGIFGESFSGAASKEKLLSFMRD